MLGTRWVILHGRNCSDNITNNKILVHYSELAKTSLDKHLKESTPNLETSLDWSMQIAEGTYI